MVCVCVFISTVNVRVGEWKMEKVDKKPEGGWWKKVGGVGRYFHGG
jgi:hypothetical protein